MLVWQGYGVVVPVITAAVWLITQYISDALFYEGYAQLQKWPVSCALFISALLIWLIGKRLNKNYDRFFLDPKTYHLIKPTKTHRILWIRAEYWAPILVFLGSWNLIR